MIRKKRYGVYFIFKSMEQGSTFRSMKPKPKYPTGNPNYQIIKKTRSRFTYYYFYIRDEIAGPMCIRIGSYLPFQTTCYLNGHNFIEQELIRTGIQYRKKVSNIFGWRITRRFNGKLQSVLDRVDQAHHTFRAYFKNSFVKQYGKLRTYLRMEVCSNNLYDLRIKKSLDNLDAVRDTSKQILDRFAYIQSRVLNSHFDFPLLQRISLPITCKSTRIAGIKIHDTRMIRLMETTMHTGMCLNGWTSAMIHDQIIKKFQLPDYTINQLRYDLRKMKAHGLIQRNGRQYSYVLTKKGIQVTTLFMLFHKRLCGPLANSLFNHRPNKYLQPNSKLEKLYHKADDYIEKITELLAA